MRCAPRASVPSLAIRVFAIAAAAACAPLDAGPGTAEDWQAGESAGCDVVEGADLTVPFTMLDDRGHELAPRDGTSCVQGAEPHPHLQACADVDGPCACRWVCRPECALSEVCTEDGACVCHAAYEDSALGCVWPGIVDNPSFDSCAGWRFTVALGNATTPPVAEVRGGRLHLGLTHPCTSANAIATARLPARAEFPDGAALVFDYMASDAKNGPEQDPGILVALDDTFFSPAPAAEPRTHRECVRLDELPRLARVAFHIDRMGACFPETITDWHFRVDDVRLEAAPECAD